MKFAHLSDLHFGRNVKPDQLCALESDLTCQAPGLLVLSGDVTDRGRCSQFRWAKGFLDSLAIPYISVPGNREICISAAWEWLFPRMAMMRYKRFFGNSDRVMFVNEQWKVAFIGLNSVHSFPSWPGTIDRSTRHWLREQAALLKDYRKVLFLHHPVIPVVRASSFWAHTLSEAGEVLNICSETGIRLILQGHKHRSAVMELDLPQRGARVVVSAGGAPLMSVWDPAYHMIELQQDAVEIRPREYSDGQFRANGSYRFPEAKHPPGETLHTT